MGSSINTSVAAHHRDDLAVDLDIFGAEHHGLHRGVGRRECDFGTGTAVGLDGGLATRNAGHNDVAIVRIRDLGGHNEIAVEDAEVDHRIAAHPEHEEFAVAGEIDGNREEFLDVLLGEHVGARSDVADEWYVTDRPAFHHRSAVDVVSHLDGTWLGGVTAEVAETLQRVEVAVDRGWGCETHRIADLSNRWWVAALADLLFDELENVSLPCTDRGSHANSVLIVNLWVKHLYREQLFDYFVVEVDIPDPHLLHCRTAVRTNGSFTNAARSNGEQNEHLESPATEHSMTASMYPAHRTDVVIRSAPVEINYTARRAIALLVVVVAVALGAFAASATVGALADVGGRPAAASDIATISAGAPIVRIHVAQPGDTLWSIADRYRGEVGQDRFVDALIDVNGGTSILAGQAVRLR